VERGADFGEAAVRLAAAGRAEEKRGFHKRIVAERCRSGKQLIRKKFPGWDRG
jgi:hypothetical protein